jgi:hypothetical protein
MTPKLLVRHPAPYGTESLPGYLLRLSELNGYATPWSILRLAGMKQNEVRTTGMRTAKLAAITSRPRRELDKIAFAALKGADRSCRLLGHSLVLGDIDLTSAKFCPRCVREQGFIEAQWHLVLSTGCPLHRTQPPSACRACGRKIRWFRMGLLTCECGQSLPDEAPTLTDEECGLLDIIRSKALRAPLASSHAIDLPCAELLAMDLRALLSAVRTIGRQRLRADGRTEVDDASLVLKAAAQTFSNWPAQFHRLLADLGDQQLKTAETGVCAHFRGLYTALFKNVSVTRHGQAVFLKQALVDFAVKHWGEGFVDHKLLGARKADLSGMRFLTVTQFAKHLNVSQSTASRHLRRNRNGYVAHPRGSSRMLIDMEKVTTLPTAPGKVLQAREASRRLGLSVAVLRLLREGELYQVLHMLPSRPGYHEHDVNEFRQRLTSLAGERNYQSAEAGTMTLRQILNNRHDSASVKVQFLEKIFSGVVTIRGSLGGSVEGLLLEEGECKRVLEILRLQSSEGTLSQSTAAQRLHCDPACIQTLASWGMLSGQRAQTGLRITNESLQTFRKEWTTLAQLAKARSTSARALMKICVTRNITALPVAAGPRRQSQWFIRIADVKSLCEEGAVNRPQTINSQQPRASAPTLPYIMERVS